MRSLIVALLICFIHSEVSSQVFPSDIWHEGKLVTLDSDTLKGRIKYDIDNDLIQLQKNEKGVIKTFSARKILYFEIFDQSVEYFRKFYALPYKVRPNYSVPLLFELLYQGKLTLLTREYTVQETVPTYNTYYRSPGYTREKLEFHYYFLREGEDIEKYLPKKSELLSVMRDKAAQVKKFMKKNKLRPDRKVDLIKITTYYNSLIDS